MSWTTRQKIIFGYSAAFCGTLFVGADYFIYSYFFNPRPDQVRDRLSARETIVGREGMKRYKVDAYVAGVGGLRWRNKPFWFHMHADRDFPRNGEVVFGSECKEYPGWLKVWDRPFWLPIRDGSFTYMKEA